MNALEQIELQLRASVAARNRHPSESRSTDPVPRPREKARAPRGPARRRRFIRFAGAAVALAGVVVVLGVVASGPGSGTSRATAATLERLARIAASGPSLVPGPGQYLYVESLNYWSVNQMGRAQEDCISYAGDRRQVWKAADGSGLMRDTTQASTYTSSQDRATCRAMHAHIPKAGTSNAWFAANCFPLAPFGAQALSTDPRTLFHQIQRINGRGATRAQEFDTIGSFLQETDASPQLRAALYRAAALIRGVQVLGPVRDRLGRSGLGVALTTHQERDELIFDARTAALLAQQITSALPGLTGWTEYRSARLVDHLPHPPPVPLTPPCQSTGAGYSRSVPGGAAMTGRSGR